MEHLSDFLFDPRRLADIGLTEDELLADLMWPAPSPSWPGREGRS